MSQQKRPKNMIKLNLIEKHLTYTLNIDTISRFFIILLIEEERQAKFEKKSKSIYLNTKMAMKWLIQLFIQI